MSVGFVRERQLLEASKPADVNEIVLMDSDGACLVEIMRFRCFFFEGGFFFVFLATPRRYSFGFFFLFSLFFSLRKSENLLALSFFFHGLALISPWSFFSLLVLFFEPQAVSSRE